ncbi:hypothetical protein TNCV_942551 [Trichonephila clavipes]|nr:hypothetical protein TNCV_942551 [Trichonephila clavipes]
MGDELLDQWGEFLSRLRLHFFPANPISKSKLKACSPIGRENLGHWSNESLQKILGRPRGISNPVHISYYFNVNKGKRVKNFNAIPQVLRQEIKISSEIRSSDGNVSTSLLNTL